MRDRKWYHVKFILLQVFAAYYIIFFSINFFQIGIPTTAYFSDEYKAKVTLLGPPEKDKDNWSKSSLEYVNNSTTLECSLLSAAFMNGIDSEPMLTNLRYGIYKDINGRNDTALFIGEVNKKLGTGESYTISYDISEFGSGKYVMKVFQEEGHPGKSTPTAESVNYNGKCTTNNLNEIESPQPETPQQSQNDTSSEPELEEPGLDKDSEEDNSPTVNDSQTGESLPEKVEEINNGNEEITNESSQDN
ncbi:hypothetical protein ACFW35_02610 [Fictibacillus sp. NPDC058756]|uniref:hypothetical protein n=1 Tax=Fictibacillus sp. NPDC058756 TaxID=3346625 RepID=UPI00368E7B9B